MLSAVNFTIMATKYKLYTIEEDKKTIHKEFYTKKEIEKFNTNDDDKVIALQMLAVG